MATKQLVNLTAETATATIENYVPVPGRVLSNHLKTGVVVSARLMDRTVKIRLWGKRFEKKVMKHFKTYSYHLVHDPRNSVRQGDVIAVSSGWRASQHKRHIVRHILAPFGPGIDERPPVPTEEELIQSEVERRQARADRAAAKIQEMRKQAAENRAAKEARKARKGEKARLARLEQQIQQTSIDDVD